MCAKPYDDGDDQGLSPIQAALQAQQEAKLKSQQLAEEIEVFKSEISPEVTAFAQQIAEVWSKKLDRPSLGRVLASYKGRGRNAKTLVADLEAQGLPKHIIQDTVRYYNQMGNVGGK